MKTKSLQDKRRWFCCLFVILFVAFSLASCSRTGKAKKIFQEGQRYEKADEYDKAIKEYTQVIKLDPNHFLAYKHRGIMYTKKKEYEKALLDLSKAIQIKPEDFSSYYNQGIAYSLMGQMDEAIKKYSKAIELDSKYVVAYLNRGAAYMKLKEYHKAIADCTKAIELKPDFAKPYMTRGLAYLLGLQKVDLAQKDFQKAKEIDPQYTEKIEKLNEKIENYKNQLKLSIQFPDGKDPLSIPELGKFLDLIEKDPNNYKNYLIVANLFLSKGEGARAIEYVQKAIAIDPDEAYKNGAHVLLSMSYYYSGELKKSYAATLKALEVNPNDEKAMMFKKMLEKTRDEHYNGELPEKVTFGGYDTAADALRARIKRGYAMLGKETEPDKIVLLNTDVKVNSPSGWLKHSNVVFRTNQKALLQYQKVKEKRFPMIAVTKDNAPAHIKSAIEYTNLLKQLMEKQELPLTINDPVEKDVKEYKASYVEMRDEKKNIITIWYQFFVDNTIISLQYINNLDQHEKDFSVFEELVQSISIEKK